MKKQLGNGEKRSGNGAKLWGRIENDKIQVRIVCVPKNNHLAVLYTLCGAREHKASGRDRSNRKAGLALGSTRPAVATEANGKLGWR